VEAIRAEVEVAVAPLRSVPPGDPIAAAT